MSGGIHLLIKVPKIFKKTKERTYVENYGYKKNLMAHVPSLPMIEREREREGRGGGRQEKEKKRKIFKSDNINIYIISGRKRTMALKSILLQYLQVSKGFISHILIGG